MALGFSQSKSWPGAPATLATAEAYRRRVGLRVSMVHLDVWAHQNDPDQVDLEEEVSQCGAATQQTQSQPQD